MINSVNNNKVVSADYDPYNISKEDFLKIYLKMLELQDPTEPLNVKDMIEQNYQLEQISFLTQLQNTMQTLTQAQQLNYVTQLSSLIGKNVVISADKITDPTANYVLISPDTYTGVTVSIMDATTGSIVKEYKTDLEEGLNNLDLSNLTPGEYYVKVTKDGQSISTVLGEMVKVNYISLSGNTPLLGTDHGEQPLENVVYISS